VAEVAEPLPERVRQTLTAGIAGSVNPEHRDPRDRIGRLRLGRTRRRYDGKGDTQDQSDRLHSTTCCPHYLPAPHRAAPARRQDYNGNPAESEWLLTSASCSMRPPFGTTWRWKSSGNAQTGPARLPMISGEPPRALSSRIVR